MANPATSARMNVNGHLGQSEIFSWGISLGSTVVPDQAAAQASNDDLAGALEANMTTIKSLLSTDGGIDQVKTYWYNTGGSAPANFITETAVTGGVGTGVVSQPLQNALVCTLNTAIPTRRTRGRIYLPCTGLAFTNHQMTQAACTGVAGAMAALLTAIGALDFVGVPVVVSTITGTAQVIDSVRVDSRVDTQRRRAQQQTVLFTATATTP